MRSSVVLLGFLCFAIAACAPTRATPEVIRDTSRQATLTAAARPSATPTGPTRTPTPTSTPYIRPTDPAQLDLALPIVRVGEETITLGQFRARVRYERFLALDNARRLIERVGLEKVNLTAPGENPTADTIAATFNTLANHEAFGIQIYDVMIREAIIRAEYRARGLKVDPKDVRDFWVRQLDLQREKDIDAVLPKAQDDYIALAGRYSGLSHEAIQQVAETFVMSLDLRPIIARENVPPAQVVQFKLKAIRAATRSDAEAALAQIKGGGDFRGAACRYSTDPTVHGNGGELGFKTRGEFVAGLNVAPVFQAGIGELVGPLQSPVSWYIFRVKDRRQNADGDTLVNAQAILVGTETLANDLKRRAGAGEDFGALACQYSLDKTGGNGGDLGFVGAGALPPEVVSAVQNAEYGLLGPIETASGVYVVAYEDRKFDVPKPEDVERAQNSAFDAWQRRQMSSSLVSPLSDAWRKAIPADPLPREVAPFMREELLGLPTPNTTTTPTPGATPAR